MVSAFAGVMLGVNYPIGAVFLLIPWIFTNAGFAIASIVTLSIVVLYNLLGHMMLEIMSRAEAMTKLKERGLKGIKPDALIEYDVKPEITTERSFWFIDMTSLFLPKSFVCLQTVCTLFCLQCWMMITASSWGVGMAAYIPIFDTCSMYEEPDSCWSRYAFWVGIWAIWGIFSTHFGLASSNVIGHINTVARFTAMLVMVGTSIASLATDIPIYEAPPSKIEPSETDKVMVALSVELDMMCLLLSLPMIVSQMKKRDSRTLKTVVTVGLILLAAVILTLGFICGSALGSPNIPEVTSLAWIGYASDGESQTALDWVLEKCVLLLPTWVLMINCTLYATTLTKTYQAMWPKIPKWAYSGLVFIIPTLGTLFIHNFSTLVTIASIALFYIVIINTSLLQIYSKRKIPIKSEFEGMHSSNFVSIATLIIGVVLIVGPIWNLMFQPFKQ